MYLWTLGYTGKRGLKFVLFNVAASREQRFRRLGQIHLLKEKDFQSIFLHVHSNVCECSCSCVCVCGKGVSFIYEMVNWLIWLINKTILMIRLEIYLSLTWSVSIFCAFFMSWLYFKPVALIHSCTPCSTVLCNTSHKFQSQHCT